MSTDSAPVPPAAGKSDAPSSTPIPDGTICFQPDTATGGPSDPHEPGRVRVGEPLGRYQIVGVLGQGGMGVVLKAHDPMIDRHVAIKVLAEDLANDATARERFLAEARAAGKLNHPNVAAIYEICQEGSTHFLVMELITGGSLDDLLQERPLSVLEATHRHDRRLQGHGRGPRGRVDPSRSQAGQLHAAPQTNRSRSWISAWHAATPIQRHLTQTGMIVGTPLFMSPEQCQAKPLDAPERYLFARGHLLHACSPARRPFDEADSVTQLMYLHCHGPVPDPQKLNPSVPAACVRIVARAMAKAPTTAIDGAEMLADLEACRTPSPARRRFRCRAMRCRPESPGSAPAAAAAEKPRSPLPLLLAGIAAGAGGAACSSGSPGRNGPTRMATSLPVGRRADQGRRAALAQRHHGE